MRFKNYTILFFLVASFWFGSHAKATNILDQTFSFANYLYLTDGWHMVGQIIQPSHNNISQIDVNHQSYTAPDSAIVVICHGFPSDFVSQANIEANLTTCNFSGSTLVRSQNIVPVDNGFGSTERYIFTTPVPVDVGGDYYIGFYPQNPHGVVAMYHSGGDRAGMILNGGVPPISGANMGLQTYYSDTYTPPPSAPQYTIQLLTPATTTPFTTYYGQPASYTFNYIDPLHWYPQIRFMVKRKADAKASAWPDYVNSATFWTSATATSTLTYGTASFQLPDGYYDLDVYFWANIPASPVHATTTFTINSGGSYGGYSFATSTLIKPPTFSTADVCGDIATSTMFGAIECGMTKAFVNAITWAFAPSFDTLQNFKVSYDLFKGCFPFNAYFQLTDTITNAASSTASTTSGTIKIPFIHTIAGGHTFYMLDAVSSSTLSRWIGATNYSLFRTTIGYFFWLLAAAIVFFTIKFI